MGSRTNDDTQLYKPAVDEQDYGALVSENFDLSTRVANQIKVVYPAGEIDMNGDTVYVVTTGSIAADAQVSFGASNRYDFDNRNSAFTEAPERAGHFVHDIDLSLLTLSPEKVGLGLPIGESGGRVLMAIWEQNSEDVWVLVASAWVRIVSFI